MSDDDKRSEQRGVSGDASRRDYLKLASAAAVGVVGSASTVAAKSDDAELGTIQFGKRVDMVEDAGADPTGGESITDVVQDAAAENTLLVFPPGEYFVGSPITVEGFHKLGLLGEGERGDVTFVFPSGITGGDQLWLRALDIDQYRYENIDWDITAEQSAPGYQVSIGKRMLLKDWEIHGRGDGDPTEQALNARMTDPNGLGVIENYVSKTGSANTGPHTPGRIGCYVGPGNVGTLRFVECQLEEFENNGIYASASAGPIQVEGGVYRNNDISQLRLSGPDSYIDGALCEVDYSTYRNPETLDLAEVGNTRGIWWESKRDPVKTGGEIRNTEVRILDTPNSSGGIVVRNDGGACTIRDSHVQMEVTRVPNVLAKAPIGDPPGTPAPPEPHSIVMDNVLVDGGANDWTAVVVHERPGTRIENCTVDVTFRDGITLAECDGAVVKDTTINTGGPNEPLNLWGTCAELSNLSSNNVPPLSFPDGDADCCDCDDHGKHGDGEHDHGKHDHGEHGGGHEDEADP